MAMSTPSAHPITPPQRRAIVVAALGTLWVTTLLCALVLFTSPQGILAFALIGTRFSEGDPDGTTGYDGQFVYFIARDGAAAVPYIDGPTLRYQRVGYPLTARLLALGHPDLVPWALVIVNLVGHALATGLLATLLAGLGTSPYYALVYAFWVGCLFALRFNLTELLCYTYGLGAVALYLRARYRAAIVLLMLSTLTKELGLVIAAGLALHALASRRVGWALLIFGGPALAFLSWWGVMRLWLGDFPTRYPAAYNIRFLPLSGLFAVDNPVEFALLTIFLAIPTVALLLLALRAGYREWRAERKLDWTVALLLPSAAFVLFMPSVSWQDQVAAYRVALPIVAAGLLFVAAHHPRRLRVLAAVWLPATAILLLLPQLWLGG
jgi:hypothetical protein